MSLTLRKFLDIELYENFTFIDFFIHVLVLNGFDRDEVMEWKVKKLRETAGVYINEFKQAAKSPMQAQISNDVGELKFKPLHTFTFGEFIDLDVFGKKNQVAKVCALTYRKFELSKYDKDVYEEWGGYSAKREQAFLNTDASLLIGGYKEILTQKQNFLKLFPELFEKPFDYEKELEKVEDEKERKVILEEKQKDEVKKAMNFDLMINHLSGGDITKYDEVLNTNVYKVFRFLKTQKYTNDN